MWPRSQQGPDREQRPTLVRGGSAHSELKICLKEAEEMSQSIKPLLCKHKALSLIPNTHIQLGVAAHAYDPSAGEVETDRS